jgi:hypothetical protein
MTGLQVGNSKSLWNDKRFTLPNYPVEPYRKIHRKNRSSHSTCLIVCTRPNFARILVQTKKLKKAASKF